jgi:hypothetical protein
LSLYGYSIDNDIHGIVLNSGIKTYNMALVDISLAAPVAPSLASLREAFLGTTRPPPLTSKSKTRSFQFDTRKALLEKAKSAEIGQSHLLLQETVLAIEGDTAGLQLLVAHGARFHGSSDLAFTYAAASGSLFLVQLLLSCRPASSLLLDTCLTITSSAMYLENKLAILGAIVNHPGGLLATDKENLLNISLDGLPGVSEELPEMLLKAGVRLSSRAARRATLYASRTLLAAITSGMDSKGVLEIFRHARESDMLSDRRYWVYRHLLDRGVHDVDELSEALLSSINSGTEGDWSLPKLLLEHGASAHYKDGAAFHLAFCSHSLDAVRILSQYLVDYNQASLACDLARADAIEDRQVRYRTYQRLLPQIQDRDVSQLASHALAGHVSRSDVDLAVVQLLLHRGADPNRAQAYCFVQARNRGAKLVFRALSKYVNLGIVLLALLDSFETEQDAVIWYTACLEEQAPGTKISDAGDLLFRCIEKFPLGHNLLRLLLSHGLSVSAMRDCSLRPDWPPEPCTALIWALFCTSHVGVSNRLILTLLSKGGPATLPAYFTPGSKMSAVIGCLLSPKRTAVLKALLQQDDRDQILDHIVPGSWFGKLASYPEVFDDGSSELLGEDDEVSVRLAALFLGNLEGFQALQIQEMPDDGTLHLAAFLALPRFVHWLLEQRHNADHRAETFDFMTPLGVACSSRPQPWCRVANNEAAWDSRLAKTIRLLVPRTDITWRHRHRSVLHLALENGPKITAIMVNALNIRDDPLRDTKYLYTDKTGMCYSPDEYVDQILKLSPSEKFELQSSLLAANLTPRCFRETELLDSHTAL